jgi:hypothetical protein
MLAHGFTIPQMVELVPAGLASASAERIVAGDRWTSPACASQWLAGGRWRSFDGPDPQTPSGVHVTYGFRSSCDAG